MDGIVSIKSKTVSQLAEQLSLPLFQKGVIIPSMHAVIRWGARFPVDAELEINSDEAIAKASDKQYCRQFLRENNIFVPIESETDFPVIGRTKKHSQGRGFFVCNNEWQVEQAKSRGAVYFSKLYKKTNEYRVHVAGGRAILVSIKVGDKSNIIWNKRRGFTFRHMRRSEWLDNDDLMKMVRMCKKAVKLLGLDFGAVDVMAGDEPQFVISEINTSPALSPLAVQKYVKFFKQTLDSHLT